MLKARRLSSSSRLFSAACLAVFAAFGIAADVQAGDAQLKAISSNPESLRAAREAGFKVSSFCVNCHGEGGVSKLPDVPNLAGQNPDYLLEQTRKFGNGKRKDPFMQGLIKALREEEKIQISLYYASQNPTPKRATDPELVEAGKQVFMRYCLRCHGPKALGDELIPRLASQHKEYITVAVTRYRDRTGERQDPQMTSAVSPLKDDEIRMVAAYLSTLGASR